MTPFILQSNEFTFDNRKVTFLDVSTQDAVHKAVEQASVEEIVNAICCSLKKMDIVERLLERTASEIPVVYPDVPVNPYLKYKRHLGDVSEAFYNEGNQ